jgi:hypothetical protein
MITLLLAIAITTQPLEHITSVGYDLPKHPNKGERFVFYVHGRLIENHGLRPHDDRLGTYEYLDILKTLASRGLHVISKARPHDTDPHQFARHVSAQIDHLIRAGVPPDHITVIGASKGAVITMLISTVVRNPKIRYVIMSNCNSGILQSYHPDLHGAVLSIYDEKDEYGTTCKPIFDAARSLRRHEEIETHLGIGHALLYSPRPQWVDPAVAWAKE